MSETIEINLIKLNFNFLAFSPAIPPEDFRAFEDQSAFTL